MAADFKDIRKASVFVWKGWGQRGKRRPLPAGLGGWCQAFSFCPEWSEKFLERVCRPEILEGYHLLRFPGNDACSPTPSCLRVVRPWSCMLTLGLSLTSTSGNSCALQHLPRSSMWDSANIPFTSRYWLTYLITCCSCWSFVIIGALKNNIRLQNTLLLFYLSFYDTIPYTLGIPLSPTQTRTPQMILPILLQ